MPRPGVGVHPGAGAAAIFERDRPAPSVGLGADPEHLEGVAAGQVIEGHQGSRVELAEGGTQCPGNLVRFAGQQVRDHVGC